MMSKTLVFVLAAFVVLACGIEDIQELGDNDGAAKSMATPEADDELGEGVGGRGGASLSTTGSFTLSSGGNAMGNEEDNELGEGGAFQSSNKKAMKAMNDKDFLQKAVPQVEALLKQGPQSHKLLNCTAVNKNKKLSEYFKAWRHSSRRPFEATERKASSGKGSMTFQFLKKAKVISMKTEDTLFGNLLGEDGTFFGRRRKSSSRRRAGRYMKRAAKAVKNKGAKKASTELHALYKTMLCLTQKRSETECCVSKSIVTQPEQKEADLSKLSKFERKKYTTALKLW